MKKALKEQLTTEARKWARQNAAGDERAAEAYEAGAKWWSTASLKPRRQYERELEKAHQEAIGPVTFGIRMQIANTAMLMAHRDRLQAEVDQMDELTSWVQGSMKQPKKEFDQRAIELKKVIAQVTDELTALGLNYNATPSKVVSDKKKGVDAERDGLTSRLDMVKGMTTEVPDF